MEKKYLSDVFNSLVSIKSISGTSGEVDIAKKIYKILKKIDYFKKYKDNLKLIDIENDNLNRKFVYAFYKNPNKTKKTIIITGHLDVVDVDEFKHLKDVAFDFKKCTDRINELSLDKEVTEDLKSNNWIFGRGVADMKFGLALNIYIMKKIISNRDFQGNIIFLSVPGEETNSEGMLEAVKYLDKIQIEKKLDYLCMFMPECFIEDGTETKYIHMGAIGKIMPLFFFVGKETHADEPFKGVNPIMMSSELNRLLELNSEFSYKNKKTVTPPPICLKQVDLKELYSAQTALYSAAYYNFNILDFNYELFMKKLKKLLNVSNENVLKRIKEKALSFKNKIEEEVSYYDKKIHILTYSDLYKKAEKNFKDDLDVFIKNRIDNMILEKIDNQKISINIIKLLVDISKTNEPTVIISFAPPVYPSYYPNLQNNKGKKIVELINYIREYGERKYNIKFKQKDYYMVSDLSYTGLKDINSINEVLNNIPLYESHYDLPYKSINNLNIPAIILGPYGKDFHKNTERLNIPYSFEILPDIYEKALYKITGGDIR